MVELDSAWMEEMGTRVLLTDGSEFLIDVREYDKVYPPELLLAEVVEFGESLAAYDTAVSWIAAHEAEILDARRVSR